MIEFHDPRGVSAIEIVPYELEVELTEGTPVGFLANGFPDSVAFLEAIASALRRYVDIVPRHWNKGDDSIVASDAMLGEIRDSCHAVVAAYGH